MHSSQHDENLSSYDDLLYADRDAETDAKSCKSSSGKVPYNTEMVHIPPAASKQHPRTSLLLRGSLTGVEAEFVGLPKKNTCEDFGFRVSARKESLSEKSK